MFEFVTARELYELMQVGSQIEKDQLEYVELDGWVRTNRNNGSIGFIELNDGTYFKNVQLVYNKGDESYRDMQLMSMCKHAVITNSSFGWWGAWLIENPNKITCSPDYHINTTHTF